ncbi:MAG: hypothetical protein FK733_15040 [Asgard group archaeon]|nr:hypothetical protein [Asgard group archaeon]
MADATEARIALMNTKIRKIQISMRLLIWSVVPILLLTLGLAWIFYPEPYEFITEFISNLGNYDSYHDNLDNSISVIIMTVGFITTGFASLIVSILYFIRPGMRIKVIKFQNSKVKILKSEPGLLYAYLKGFLYLLMCIGAMGIAVPADHATLKIFHLIGAVMFIFSFGLVNFVHQLLRFTRKHNLRFEKKKWDFYFDTVIVSIVLSVMVILGIAYAVNKLAGITHPAIMAPLWQKILLIVNLVAVFALDIDDI